MAILVTGGTGYIGSHTVTELLKEGYEVIVIDNLINSAYDVVDRIKKLSKRDFVFYKGDITDESLLFKIFTENNITDVIHFAGLKSVGESFSKPVEYYNINVTGTLKLVNAMLLAGVQHIIFSSSATVYGIPEKIPLTEQCSVGATTNPYGTSKFMAERILQDIAKEGANKQVISSQADSLIKISRSWADFFPANTSNQPV
ncbi:SDR family NAD(P)-dependent oxidoreductase [Escherichia coli]|nr:SDR family NAD(P)-dependent oxidoreductase [Escherichia coli]